MTSSKVRGSGRSPKVKRMIDKYGLGDAGEELEARWTRIDDRWSLRDLAAWFNKRLLRNAMSEAGMNSVEEEIDNLYRLLTDDEVSGASRIQIERRLERAGLEPDELQRDFVSYQAIRTYLLKYRNAERVKDDRDQREKVAERVQKLAGRTATVTESQLEQLQAGGDLDVGPFRTMVDVRIYCEDCNTQYTVDELLEEGGCDCAAGTA
ncbi:rod-determining factor RdfA [Halomarina halobia]|uniref:Rod-determining factor RdfA n=1 Tax=Halomarina halobia TaxID=3033386 RepID=A0ABD6ADG7_9EURY|nr:rod-determining factor RdfA [Halomarina sp. PSR21]